MATGPRYRVPFRRRREGRTNYYIRRKLLTGREVRAVLRRSNRNVSIQFVDFGMEGDKILATAGTKDLRAMGWEHSCSSIPAAYLAGYLAGKRAVAAGIEYAILDLGMQNPRAGGVLFAAVAGMCDAGVEIPHGDDVFPSEERLMGAHIGDGIEKAVNGMKEKMEAE